MLSGSWVFSCLTFLFFPYLMSAAQRPLRSPQTINDVEYSRIDGNSLRMDISLPAASEATPAVILVHGGGWVAGDRRRDFQPLFQPLNDAGFAWFSISYRLATDVTRFGVAIDDVQTAIRYVISHAAEFHIDPDKIALIGESAGGQLAAMAALRGDTATSVKAVVAFYTPTDLVSLVKTSHYIPPQIRSSVEGTPFASLIMAGLSQLSPIDNVRPQMPPFLFIHGTDDPLVPFEQSRAMCDRMKDVGASCEVYPVEGAGHGLRWWEASPRVARAYKHELIEWLHSQLSSPEI